MGTPMKLVLVIAGALVACGGLVRGDGEWQAVIGELSSPDYPTRMGAIEKLSECGEDGLDEVLSGLFSEQANEDPEIGLLRGQVLRGVFRNVVIGRGSAETGVQWARLLFIDKKGLAGAVPLVVRVRKGSPGDRAGLKPGDTIRAIDGVRLPEGDSFLHFRSRLENAQPGDRWKLQTWRLEMSEVKHRVEYGKSAGRVMATLVMGDGEREKLRKETPGQYERWLKSQLRRLGLEAE